MVLNNFFTISDFAKLMGISRQTLIYYDRIGLFKPINVLNNKYRLYSRSQINVISLILMLSEMGVPLKKIKTIVDHISPDTAIEILRKQQKEAEEKLYRYRMLENMIRLRIEQITFGKEISKKSFPLFSVMEIKEDIPLYVGDDVNCSLGDIDDDFIIRFYKKCENLNFPLIFSSGQMKSKENIIAGKSEIVSNMCFTLKDFVGANAVIPKGLYTVGYVHGDYGETECIYRDLLAFIKEKGLRITGNAYEEYLLDELAESDPNRFIMKILIQVEYETGGENSF